MIKKSIERNILRTLLTRNIQYINETQRKSKFEANNKKWKKIR